MIAPSITLVKADSRIRRERILPQAGEVVAHIGQQVSPVQVVARSSRQKEYAIIPAARILGVAAEEVPEYLLVEEGAVIQREKPLLQKSSLFGNTIVRSPVNGTLYQLSQGYLVLQQTPELIELRAMVQGYVTNVLAHRGVVIETQGAVVQALWGSGREGYGTLEVVVTAGDEPLQRDHIGSEARGKILVAGQLRFPDVLEAAAEYGVRGLVVGSAPGRLLPLLAKYHFPIIVTDGFHEQAMASPLFQLLQEMKGREASIIGGAGKGRQRPEIIIPLPPAAKIESEAADSHTLKVGQTVRILRAPHTGKVGKIVNITRHPRETGSGLRLPGADVRLQSTDVVFVPYLNLDLIV
jgi:hypothetical protein